MNVRAELLLEKLTGISGNLAGKSPTKAGSN